MAKTVEVIVGTYEEFLLGYRLDTRNKEQDILVQSFADKSHAGSLKCVAASKQYVVTGGSDDRIFVYDMKNRKQSQILLHHEGTINALAFTPDGSHLLSGSEDGKMVATRVISWHSEASWKKAHGGLSVTQISCHPSGKLALTLGNDLTLKTWNLVKGRVAYKTNLKSKITLANSPDCLSWSPDGEHFTLAGPRHAEIWSIKIADVITSIKSESKPNCAVWVNDLYVIFGLDNGKILIVSADKNEEPITVDAHSSRIKSMAFVNNVLATASSTGEITLWSINIENKSISMVVSTNIGCRPTCLALLDLTQFGPSYDAQPTKQLEKITLENSQTQVKNVQQRGVVTIEYEESNTLEKIVVNQETASKVNKRKIINQNLKNDKKKKSIQLSKKLKNDGMVLKNKKLLKKESHTVKHIVENPDIATKVGKDPILKNDSKKKSSQLSKQSKKHGMVLKNKKKLNDMKKKNKTK